jgi:hypothetical protein
MQASTLFATRKDGLYLFPQSQHLSASRENTTLFIVSDGLRKLVACSDGIALSLRDDCIVSIIVVEDGGDLQNGKLG